jgi:rare lipoprotein A
MTHTRDNVVARRDGALRRAVLGCGILAAASSPAFAGSAKVQGEGIASFYGRAEHGGPTASGERFNMHAMTAAHRTAPLGSHLKVTNLRNGKTVVVRINDRGPFVKGRIIDLSRGAADVLGFTGAGLTRVAVISAGAQDPSFKVASLDTDTTEPRKASADGPAVLSDVDRLLIDRTSTDR